MKYKIEQWDKLNKMWFQIGESVSAYCSLTSVKELKKRYPSDFFRIVSILDLF